MEIFGKMDGKYREKRLRELHRHSYESFEKFSTFDADNNVVDATSLFEAKKRYDKWWKDALERINNIDKGKQDE